MADDIIKDPNPTQPLVRPKPITPQFRPPVLTREQRDLSIMPTQIMFDNLRATAKCYEGKNHDDELWSHLAGRLKYLLNLAGMR